MADLIKKIKIKKEDGTYTDYIPIGAEAKNVDVDGESVEYKLNKKPYYYNSVADMKADVKLKVGDMAVTLGYYEPNDGGSAEYRIVNGTHVEDGGSYHHINNSLWAELIIKNKNLCEAKQFGVHCNKITNDAIPLQNAINYCQVNKKDLLLDGYAYVKTTIDTKGVKIIGLGIPARASNTYTSYKYGYIGWNYLRNVGDGAKITFIDYGIDVLTTGSGIISDVANPILVCDHEDGKFKLENLCICGWIRNEGQEGLRTTANTIAEHGYLNGKHYFKNVNVINCGGNGMHLHSLELVTVEELGCYYNLGNGLLIEGHPTCDAPFEYTKFQRCHFAGNKYHGVYALNAFRKQVEFEKCDFGYNGLYQILGRTIPSLTSEVSAGIKIQGYNDTLGDGNQDNFKVTECEAEELECLVNIDTYSNGHVFNNIEITHNVLYPVSNDNVHCLLYYDNYYCRGFNYYGNFVHGQTSLILSDNVLNNGSTLIAGVVDNNYYNLYGAKLLPNLVLNSSLNENNSARVYQRFGNLVRIYINATATANIDTYALLLSQFPAPITNERVNVIINGTLYKAGLYMNRQLTVNSPISSGDTVIIDAWYYIPYYS